MVTLCPFAKAETFPISGRRSVHQRAAGEEQVVGRGRVDVVAVGGEAALDPAQQQLAVLLAELHLAHMLIERRDELFILPSRL